MQCVFPSFVMELFLAQQIWISVKMWNESENSFCFSFHIKCGASSCMGFGWLWSSTPCLYWCWSTHISLMISHTTGQTTLGFLKNCKLHLYMIYNLISSSPHSKFCKDRQSCMKIYLKKQTHTVFHRSPVTSNTNKETMQSSWSRSETNTTLFRALH